VSITFISQNIWPQLTKAVRDSQNRCAVAVAYFGKGARRLLPLARGSQLVVDASERSVASGQTCPADLIKLAKHGVAIYSVPNLHAKVFVLGRAAYIGSANVSSRSSTQLVEALIRTTELQSVRAARQFVHDHCLYELTPTVLKRLAKIYRPPHVPNEKLGKNVVKDTSRRPTLPRLLLAQLHLEDWSERDQTLHDSALFVAKKRRGHPRSFELDSFRCTGSCCYQRDDLVVQIVNEGGGRILVTPPGTVLHVRTRKDGNRQVSFIYLECPRHRRRPVGALARALGRGARKRLGQDGMIRDASFAQALLNVWVK
jgi:hypothetical protein